MCCIYILCFSAFDDVIRNDETCNVNLWLYVNKMKYGNLNLPCLYNEMKFIRMNEIQTRKLITHLKFRKTQDTYVHAGQTE